MINTVFCGAYMKMMRMALHIPHPSLVLGMYKCTSREVKVQADIFLKTPPVPCCVRHTHSFLCLCTVELLKHRCNHHRNVNLRSLDVIALEPLSYAHLCHAMSADSESQLQHVLMQIMLMNVYFFFSVQVNVLLTCCNLV
jgi:hypothetical protein